MEAKKRPFVPSFFRPYRMFKQRKHILKGYARRNEPYYGYYKNYIPTVQQLFSSLTALRWLRYELSCRGRVCIGIHCSCSIGDGEEAGGAPCSPSRLAARAHTVPIGGQLHALPQGLSSGVTSILNDGQ